MSSGPASPHPNTGTKNPQTDTDMATGADMGVEAGAGGSEDAVGGGSTTKEGMEEAAGGGTDMGGAAEASMARGAGETLRESMAEEITGRRGAGVDAALGSMGALGTRTTAGEGGMEVVGVVGSVDVAGMGEGEAAGEGMDTGTGRGSMRTRMLSRSPGPEAGTMARGRSQVATKHQLRCRTGQRMLNRMEWMLKTRMREAEAEEGALGRCRKLGTNGSSSAAPIE